MIKRSYIIHSESELGKRATDLIARERAGKPLFASKEQFEAVLNTDWQEWNKEAVKYIIHVYGDPMSGKVFNVGLRSDGHISVDEVDGHFVNVPQPREV